MSEERKIDEVVVYVEKGIIEILNNTNLPTFAAKLILKGILLEIDNLELRAVLAQKEKEEE